MNLPVSPVGFRAAADVHFAQIVARLRLADRLPLRVSCRCLAHWDDPALDQLCFEREADLGPCDDLAAAMTAARKAIASGQITAGRDAALRLVPKFVTILDAEHCLVLAGEVQTGSIRWCVPVNSDAEARRVVNEACGLRTEARAATAVGDPAAATGLLARARALEGRLVDPFWRGIAAIAVDRALAA